MKQWRQVPVPALMREAQRRGDIEPELRIYQRPAEDGTHLALMVARGPDGWHLSLSHRHNLVGPDGRNVPGRLPSWEELHDVRYTFAPDDVYMAIILPPKREYVNVHKTTMHLHQIDM